MFYVIVATDNGNIATRVASRSSVANDTPPLMYMEAALQQHPVIFIMIVDGADQDELGIMFSSKLLEAVENNKGRRAHFRSVEWEVDKDV
jgi:hypothetical protein